jgi:DNA (cytosine-5)-methyltransferase 1
MARQNAAALAPFPVWNDVRTFDGAAWRGLVDVVSGGFPCQDISVAGRGAGIDGKKSSLWREMARIVGEVRPAFVFAENSPALVTRGLARVLADLDALGYDAEWDVLGASDVGAPHQRRRIWILARLRTDADSRRRAQLWLAQHARQRRACRYQLDGLRSTGSRQGTQDVPDADRERRKEHGRGRPSAPPYAAAESPSWWEAEPAVGRVAYGVAARVDRLRCLGNGQVPAVAAVAFLHLAHRAGWIHRNTDDILQRRE